MSEEKRDLEERLKTLLSLDERLKTLLSKVDQLLAHPPEEQQATKPADVPEESAPSEIPQPQTPLLLQAPAVQKETESPSPASAEVREVIPLPPSAPPLLIQAPVPEKIPEPTPPPVEPASIPAVSEIPSFANPPPGEGIEVPFLIGYPEALPAAAQELEENLNRLEPKFTKMKFHLRGRGSVLYSPDRPLSENALSQVQKIRGGVLLIITRHRLYQKTPHPIGSEMARLGIYFQEVLLDAISKKAFYFDFLLGLVLFLKSQKPSLFSAAQESPKESGPDEWNGLRKRD